MGKVFQNEGIEFTIAGNKPLILNTPDSVWMVRQGSVLLFCVDIKNGETVGRRNFLFEAKESQLIFGLSSTIDQRTVALLAVGGAGTVIQKMDRHRFLAEMAQSVDAGQLNEVLSPWVGSIVQCARLDGVVRLDWSTGSSDDVLVFIEGRDDSQTLNDFHDQMLRTIVQTHVNSNNRDNELTFKKRRNEALVFEDAIKKLAAITQKEQVIFDGGLTDDSLLAACQIVARASQIEIASNMEMDTNTNKPVEARIGDIAEASRMRYRQVLLSGKWWENDNGPILAFLEDGDLPVAIVPVSPSKYELINPATREKIPADSVVTEKVKPIGYVFYRSFPNKAMNVRDILQFGISSCWKQDLVMLLLMGISGGLLGMVLPVVTGMVFDNIIPDGNKTQILQVLLFLIASAVSTTIFEITRSMAMLRMEGRIDGRIESAVWDRLLSLPVPFFRNYSAGELAMRSMGISVIRKALTGVTINSIFTSIFSIFNFFLLFFYNVKLACVAALLVFFAVGLTAAIASFQMRYQRKITEVTNKISGLTLQLIYGVAKFRIAGAEKRAFAQWAKPFREQVALNYRSQNIGNIQGTFGSVFPVLTSMVIFYSITGSKDIKLGAGEFIAFNAALGAFVGSMLQLSHTLLSINVIIPYYEMSKPILEALPEYNDQKTDPGVLKGEIEVNHVSFRYKPDAPPVLHDVSLHIKPGEYVGLVGTSGSGKSTLLRLLLNFDKPQTGKVYFDRMDLESVDIRRIRRQLGVVLQNGQLMAGDIYSNIVGSNPMLTRDDAMEAAKLAGLDKDIAEMPMGLHTVVSDGGGTLSGGQRQRLLIARAIVNKPKIIIFDEATSALDNRTQSTVSESLDQLKATKIVVAHRLSTVINCDRIYVMDKGKIIEIGNYHELMALNGVFADLAKRQLA